MMRITKVFCQELQQTVTITQARREFFSADPPAKRFHFFCDREACVGKGTRIKGVNYTVLAKDVKKYKAAHFSRLDDHHNGCHWESPLAVEKSKDPLSRQTIRAKLTDLIDVFDPYKNSSNEKPKAIAGSPPTTDEALIRSNSRGPGLNSPYFGQTRTQDFEKLVDCFLEARSGLTREQFYSLQLEVVGLGHVPFAKYFRHVRDAAIGTDPRAVIYGGARIESWSPSGIRLKFYDKFNGSTLKLFLSMKKIEEYRYRRYLLAPLEEVRKYGGYVTVFALGGSIGQRPGYGHFELGFPYLRNVVFREKVSEGTQYRDASATLP